MVVHLGAQAGVRYSIEHPEIYIQSNVVGFANILEQCRHSRVKHLMYASSSSVYGLYQSMPFKATDGVDHPVSLYAATKKSNELMAHTYSYLYGLPTGYEPKIEIEESVERFITWYIEYYRSSFR